MNNEFVKEFFGKFCNFSLTLKGFLLIFYFSKSLKVGKKGIFKLELKTSKFLPFNLKKLAFNLFDHKKLSEPDFFQFFKKKTDIA